MSIFSKIKDAIFGRKDAGAGNRPPAPVGRSGVNPAGTPGGAPAAPAAPAPVQEVDVEQVLTRIQQEKGNPELNWRTSIVDLMKLLGIDSSLDNRKELATELGYTGPPTASRYNIWLHKR